MSKPGRRIVIKTVREDVSRKMESDLAWASTLTLTGAAAEVVDRINARSNPRCRLCAALSGGEFLGACGR